MEIIYKKVDELIPYINNARTHNDEQVSQICASINEYGFTNPILIDEKNSIIAGHGRLLAAKKLKMKEVPCIVLCGLTEAQKKAYIIADNKLALNAGWNDELLKVEFENLKELDFDLNLTGFSADEIDAILDNIEDDKEIVEDEFDEEPPEEPKSKVGDIYQLGNHRLMCGDSTKEEDVEKLMNGVKADMVFTDPPYNVNYEGSDGQSIQNDDMEDTEFHDFLYLAYKNMFNSVKEGGPIYVCHADSEGLNFRSAFKEAGFKLAQCLIWVKNSFTLGRQDYQWQHEPILYGWKPGAGHYYVDDRSQSTIWNYDKPKHNDLHPTMKPLELVGKAINNSSLKGELVLDLFGGSGSTLIASEQLNRKCYMMEFDPKYVDVIIKRWEQFTGNKAELIEEGDKA